ncbi:hypothetical protein [Actinomadura madurae]|uniref:Uncharacterized protein n=1 Tax=Actinomadura madurae TaxID=1993 RepID=A0A1I5WRQ4_9ACTN|nr:hypothetical protein [Actinomadura madurae]SFQ22475.1 hypothetical protein SAMN04489713_124106 [Actinomadura madurae]SPT51737.1 Uncharacterised protein [Actinomadura madurae]
MRFGTRQPLIFPIGHSMGEVGDGPERAHVIRRGGDLVEVDRRRFELWRLARGKKGEEPGRRGWTRRVVEREARRLGVADPAAIVDGLVADGLIAELVPDRKAAHRFALAYHLHPLMLGLGNTRLEPWLYGIGFGEEPVLRVRRDLFSIWEWAPGDDNLWKACQAYADVEVTAGGTDRDHTDPRRVLMRLVKSLHLFTSASAAYLDVARRSGAS